MARHDAVKYEAGSCALLKTTTIVCKKTHEDFKIGDSVRQALVELGIALIVDHDNHDDFIQSSHSAWQL
jgi:hypothetical protein